MIGAVYVDRFVRRPEGWRIVERRESRLCTFGRFRPAAAGTVASTRCARSRITIHSCSGGRGRPYPTYRRLRERTPRLFIANTTRGSFRRSRTLEPTRSRELSVEQASPRASCCSTRRPRIHAEPDGPPQHTAPTRCSTISSNPARHGARRIDPHAGPRAARAFAQGGGDVRASSGRCSRLKSVAS